MKYFYYDGPYTVEAKDTNSFIDTRCMSVAPDLKKNRIDDFGATALPVEK